MNEQNEPVLDSDGNMTLKFKFDQMESLVTNSWVGVTKMFQVHPGPSPMVAVTSGLAKLNDRSIANLASEFCSKYKENPSEQLDDAGTICDQFLKFFREKFEEHYRDSPLPENLRQGPNFLVGGYGRGDYMPKVFRVTVRNNLVQEQFAGPRGGLAWGGQSDAVERFLRGYDSAVKDGLEAHIGDQLRAYARRIKEQVAESVNGLLDRIGETAPSDWSLDLPDPTVQELDWDEFRLRLDYSNMPIQEAVNFVAFLVNLQAGKGRFARGIPTVGGRTHVGVIRKDGFEIINEPKLTHRNTGFGDDA